MRINRRSDQVVFTGRGAASIYLLALIAGGCTDPKPSPETLAGALNAPSAAIRLEAALALETGGAPEIEVLRGSLANRDWVVRVQALTILGHMGEPAIEVIGPATLDVHPLVRLAAVGALHAISSRTRVPWLMRVIDDDVPVVRVRGLRALADAGALSSEDSGRIVHLLKDESLKVRRWAATVAVFAGPDTVPFLTAALDGQGEQRWRAAWALSQIGPGAAGALSRLRRHLNDPDPRVRTEVQTAIESIEGRQ